MSLFNPDCREMIIERKLAADKPTTLAKKLQNKILSKKAKVRQAIERLNDDRELARLESNTIEIG